jgi:uncharacterized membrane protein YeaQ/YmgE (transglycosylase-associated protein family)
MINFMVWIVAGALIGWAASILVRTNNGQGPIPDILVGILGACVGGFFLSPLFNVGIITDGRFSVAALLVSVGGSILVLLFSKLFRDVFGYLVFVAVAMGLYIYFDCWAVASTSAFCAGVRVLPFPQ